MERHIFDNEEDWKQYRRGRFTSSEMHRLLANGKRPMTPEEMATRAKNIRSVTIEDEETLSDGAMTYIREKLAETLGREKRTFLNSAMEWGKENEPQAVLAFAAYIGMEVTDEDFLYMGGSEFVFYSMANISGGTPDLLIPDAIAEIKCPDSKQHLDYLFIPNADIFRTELPEYYAQMQANMLFCEKQKGYFVSYDPGFKSGLELKVIEVTADAEFQHRIVKKVALAKAMLDDLTLRVFELNKK